MQAPTTVHGTFLPYIKRSPNPSLHSPPLGQKVQNQYYLDNSQQQPTFTSTMAALSSLFKRKSSIPFNGLIRSSRLFSTETLLDNCPSFAQRLRDLPKDFPGTNIRKEASQVKFLSPAISFLVPFFCQHPFNFHSGALLQLQLLEQFQNFISLFHFRAISSGD